MRFDQGADKTERCAESEHRSVLSACLRLEKEKFK